MKYWYDKTFRGVICEPDCADEWIDLIWQVGCDYDGCNTIESLKRLIDELIKYSINAGKCLRDGKIFTDEAESEKSYFAAHFERDKDVEK